MKLLFRIGGAGEVKSPQPVLSIRLGPSHVCFSVSDFQTNELRQVVYYSIDRTDSNVLQLIEKAHPEILQDYYQVLIGFDFPTSCFVPSQFAAAESGKNLLGIMYGNASEQHFHSEKTGDKGVWNLYSVPQNIYREVTARFSRAKYWQQYTVDSMMCPACGSEGLLKIEFRPETFSVYACKEGNVLLAQTYDYIAPSDVLYCLLSICKYFDLDQRTVKLQLSGLVDKESSLFRELYQYFLHTDFRVATWQHEEYENPPHFFTSLNDLASCAS